MIAELWNELLVMGLCIPHLDKYEKIALAAVLIMGGVCIAMLLIGHYGPHQVAIPGVGDISILDPSFEWHVPYGSPEIGMKPDGSIGSINAYGRISAC